MGKIRHITLITDFGTKDSYVAEMKGVLYSALPEINIVDLSHEISPQNVLEGALFLERMWDYWQIPSIHIAVVDPGVGTERRILLVHESRKFLICPDNGLATFIVKNKYAEVRNVKYFEKFVQSMSNTFHGRDIMAPIAIQLVKGENWEEFGPIIDDFEVINIFSPVVEKECICGVVIHIDRFGNAITNIKSEDIQNVKPHYLRVRGSFYKIPFSKSYGDVPVGQPLCLLGSGNRLEIAVNCGSAKEELNIKVGTEVKLFLKKD